MPQSALLPSGAELQALRRALLAYYAASARDLPWRRTRDPYAIWVSEIMLQQTRVDTVVNYYARFLERFPTTFALAAADEDAVLAAWSGLGYYRRARMLHAGVREVVARYGGDVPEDNAARRNLPGVGRYTAGAIGSIAFDRAEPLVDGNVARVFARVFGLDTPIDQSQTQAKLWALAEALVPGPQPGALNQALMELGATLCTKAAPSCEHCPVAQRCYARAHDRVRVLPVVSKKRPPRRLELVGVVASNPRGDVLLVRGQTQLFGGLWNLPMREGNDRDVARKLLADLGVRARVSARTAARVEHVLTHRHLCVQLYRATLTQHAASPASRLQPRSKLAQLGVSRLTHKALEAVDALDAVADPVRT